MKTVKHISTHTDYSEAVTKLASYREAMAAAQQLAAALDYERVAAGPKTPEQNPIELADRLLSGAALQGTLGERIADTARKIEALRRAIEQQEREVIRIRGEHSRRVCRDAVADHAALVERVVMAVDALHAANTAERELRASVEAAGYSATALPPMSFTPQGHDFDTANVDWGYAPAWKRDAVNYIRAQALPADEAERRAAADAHKTPATKRLPRTVSNPGEGELIG